MTSDINAPASSIIRTDSVAIEVDTALAVGTAILAMVVVIGLATAGHYGMTIDEFNTDDYGPKALAWYTSGFTDRSHFETVEFSLWYYGPWFQILTALVQSLGLAEAALPTSPMLWQWINFILIGSGPSEIKRSK